MHRLSAQDLEAVLALVAEGAALAREGRIGGEPAPGNAYAAPPVRLESLQQLVPHEGTSYCESDLLRLRVLGQATHPRYGDPADLGIDRSHAHRLLAQSPGWRRRRLGDFSALKDTDFASRRELERTELYADIYRRTGMKHELVVGAPSARPWHTRSLALGRWEGPDFSERDRAVLSVLRPHLDHLLRATATARRARAALGVLERGAAAVVLLDQAGRIDFATEPARRLLARAFGTNGTSLPARLNDWLARPGLSRGPLTVDLADTQLVVEAHGSTLVLEERARPLPLTRREREILDLVAAGNTNAQIAEQLWITPGTVRSHLEHVYAKLGVNTRTAAVARYRDAAGGATRQRPASGAR